MTGFTESAEIKAMESNHTLFVHFVEVLTNKYSRESFLVVALKIRCSLKYMLKIDITAAMNMNWMTKRKADAFIKPLGI